MNQLFNGRILGSNHDIFFDDAINQFMPSEAEGACPDDVASFGFEGIVFVDLEIGLMVVLWLHVKFFMARNRV